MKTLIKPKKNNKNIIAQCCAKIAKAVAGCHD